MGDRVRVRLPEAALYFGMYPRKQHRVIAEPADSGTCFPTLRVFGGWPTRLLDTKIWPIFVHGASTVRDGEKLSNSTDRKSTTRFPKNHREP